MTRTIRLALMTGVLSASCLAATGGVQAADRLQKLLQVQT